MPLVSILDPMPVSLEGRSNQPRLRAHAVTITFVRELEDHALAIVASPDLASATELAERVAWGIWRAGTSPQEPLLPWDGVAYKRPSVPPHRELKSSWSRRIESPRAFLWVFDGPEPFHTRRALAGAADLGLVSGPARWDHRSQYTTLRRTPRADGWGGTEELVGELTEGEPLARRIRRRGVNAVAVLRAIASESRATENH